MLTIIYCVDGAGIADVPSGRSFFGFMNDVIAGLRRNGKERTSETYTSALNSFRRFMEGRDITADAINSGLIVDYQKWLRSWNVSMNTVSFYNRILRAVYNRAVDEGLTEQCHPFRHVYTGVGKTVKRAVTLASIRTIKSLDLSFCPKLDFARDMFLFSFYTRGMSFVDMAYLRKSDLRCGILTYSRRKTGRRLTVKWEKCMQDIVDKYSAVGGTEFMLPIIRKEGDARIQYRNALKFVNNKLKEVSVLAGMGVNLTTYVNRHSWASIAKSRDVPLSVISDGMGHDSEKTTRIYLASLDNSAIDTANKLILEDL